MTITKLEKQVETDGRDKDIVQDMREFVNVRAEGALIWAGCDSAIVGVVERNGEIPLVCYDYELLIQCFIDDETDEETARDWVDFNIVGTYIGEGTPMVLYTPAGN